MSEKAIERTDEEIAREIASQIFGDKFGAIREAVVELFAPALRNVRVSAEAAALERAAQEMDARAANYRTAEESAYSGGGYETASRLRVKASAYEEAASMLRALIPVGHSPAPAGEAEREAQP